MESLITRYRPGRLADVWGNQAIKNKWQGYVDKKDFPHSVLLYGNYGCGKTTIARIFAMDIIRYVLPSCKPSLGPLLREIDGSSIEECSAAVDFIKKGSLFSFSSIKVIFFDEAQRMQPRFKEAVLVPIENREDLYVIFAASEIKETDGGILSRVDPFDVVPPTLAELKSGLTEIAKKEGVVLSDDALESLISLSDRVPRACVKNIGALYGCKGLVTKEAVMRSLLSNVGAKHMV